MPTPAGDQVKLLDLGFAKVEDELKLTSKHTILGTPFYMSPEQYLDPSAVDARADLFSLGNVMFDDVPSATGHTTWEFETRPPQLR